MSIIQEHVVWFSDDAARRAFIQEHPEGVLVSPEIPLRMNLSVLENIAIIIQYRNNLNYEKGAAKAWELLDRAGQTSCALKRDSDLTTEERFIAKLIRSVILFPPLILIDRPGFLLPDTRYPVLMEQVLTIFKPMIQKFQILEYEWNKPLYAPH
jgi:ABC-type lipopolysaccharide export system ATPase subunit